MLTFRGSGLGLGLNERLICCRGCSEEVGLTHDAHELFLRDLTISVTVGLFNHFGDFIVGHVLSELLGDALEVSEGDFACLVIVEETESLEHLFAGVSLGHLLGHHVEELWVVDDSGAVLVDVGDHFLDLLSLWLEAKSAHGDLELLLVDVATAVSIEQIEGFLDLLLLLFGDVSSLLGSLESLLFERCLCKEGKISCQFEYGLVSVGRKFPHISFR